MKTNTSDSWVCRALDVSSRGPAGSLVAQRHVDVVRVGLDAGRRLEESEDGLI